MDARTAYRSSFRNQRAPAKPAKPPTVGGPVGMGTSATAADQAKALRGSPNVRGNYSQMQTYGMPQEVATTPSAQDLAPSTLAYEMMKPEHQRAIKGAYGRAAFQGVQGLFGDDWWDMPDAMRVQMLEGARR